MNRKMNMFLGVVSVVVALCVAAGVFGLEVFAEEETDASVGETTVETTETTVDLNDAIVLQWTVDSSLIYVLNEDSYVWTVYENDETFDPESAGYEFTGVGEWFGTAEIELTITNNMEEAVEFAILCLDELSAEATEIADTFLYDGMEYDVQTRTFLLEPQDVGVVYITVTDQVLTDCEIEMGQEDDIVGWLKVQVISPTEIPPQNIQEETEPTETTDESEPEETADTIPTETTEPIEETEGTEPSEETEPTQELETTEASAPTEAPTVETTVPDVTEGTQEPTQETQDGDTENT